MTTDIAEQPTLAEREVRTLAGKLAQAHARLIAGRK